ncbi:MAG: hypothetical protein ACJ79G_23720, partial [Myxococcales bacterium]
MEASLRNRLTFGPIMLAGLAAILVLDHNLQGSATREWMKARFPGAQRGVGGIGILFLLILILPLATREIGILFSAERIRPYPWIAGAG